jgi:hypothetical protein
VQASPDLPAARAYIARTRAPLAVQYNGLLPRRNGYALYFTVVSVGGRMGYVVKLCEDRRGRVTGSSNVSYGEESC